MVDYFLSGLVNTINITPIIITAPPINNSLVGCSPKRKIAEYKPCKEYDAALSLMLKKLIYARSTNELEMEGPATPDPQLRWFTCSIHKPWATKRDLRKLI